MATGKSIPAKPAAKAAVEADASQFIYTPDLEAKAERVLKAALQRELRLATAESCTGGALAALLTDVEGCSRVFERGFATYCDEAKVGCLGVPAPLIAGRGAVSPEVAVAMAQGALAHSQADIAVAITGFAGPAGPTQEEGLVHLAVARRNGSGERRELHVGRRGRTGVRIAALAEALDMLSTAVEAPPAP
jgi:nicotinamide-nucleotide amidase